MARSVARVHIRGERGEAMGYGTGFLVSPRLLLTNQHVLPTLAHAKNSLAEFNYQESANGEMHASTVFPLAPDALFLSDTNLDYTLVALAPDPDLAAYGWLPLIADVGKLLVGETVNIIQHPNGEPKQLAIRHHQVVDELELFLHYQTDTDPGSSGAPVFNDQWEVVALHHSGVPKRNEKGEQHIREQELSLEAEDLRQELLEAAPPPFRAAGIAWSTMRTSCRGCHRATSMGVSCCGLTARGASPARRPWRPLGRPMPAVLARRPWSRPPLQPTACSRPRSFRPSRVNCRGPAQPAAWKEVAG